MTADALTPAALMPIGELARRAHVSIKTLRHYSDIGVVPPACRTAAGYRMYGEAQRLRLETVKAMRRLGFDLGQIAAVLAVHDEVGTGLAAQLDAVRTRSAELERFALVLEAALQRCDEPTAVHLARLETLARLSACAEDRRDPRAARDRCQTLPDLDPRPTFEQLDAWLELAALLATGTSAATADDPGDDALRDLLHDAMDARTAGMAPDDPRADGLVERLLSHAGGRTPDAALPQRLLDRAAADDDLRSRRYWRLVARIKGWPEQSPQAQAVDWLAAAVRVRCG